MKINIGLLICSCIMHIHALQLQHNPGTTTTVKTFDPTNPLNSGFLKRLISDHIHRSLGKRFSPFVIKHIMQFLPKDYAPSMSPYIPWLSGSYKVTTPTKNANTLFLLGVSNRGDVFYADTTTSASTILVHKNNTEHRTHSIPLPEKWTLYTHNTLHRHNVRTMQHPIAVQQRIDEDSYNIGIYNPSMRSVISIARCHKTDQLVDINPRAAIVRSEGTEHHYLHVKNTAISIQPNNTISSIRLDKKNLIVIRDDIMQHRTGHERYIETHNFANLKPCTSDDWDKVNEFSSKARISSEIFWQDDTTVVRANAPPENPDLQKIVYYQNLSNQMWNDLFTVYLPQQSNALTCLVSVAIDSRHTAALYNMILKNQPIGFSILFPDTGVRLEHSQGNEQERTWLGTRFSANGQWVARQYGHEILLWEVKKFDLKKCSTPQDYNTIHELSTLYAIGQERNRKYKRNFVIRLTPTQMHQFNELRKKTVVPPDWERLFRLAKPKGAQCPHS